MDDTRAILEEHKKADDQASSNLSDYNSSCCFQEEQDENDLVKEIETCVACYERPAEVDQQNSSFLVCSRDDNSDEEFDIEEGSEENSSVAPEMKKHSSKISRKQESIHEQKSAFVKP